MTRPFHIDYRALALSTLASLCICSAVSLAQVQHEHFRVEKVNDHVYAFNAGDGTQHWVNGNSYAIITKDGVFVIDSHVSPMIAEANIAAIRKITDRPVKFLLNTHWHWDHNLGQGVYKQHFPDIQIIAQTETREIFVRRGPAFLERRTSGQFDTYIAEYEKALAEGKDEEGTPLTAESRKQYEYTLHALKVYKPDVPRLEIVPPDVTFEKSLTIHLGEQEIHIRHEHRANTPGDAYVWLPQDSILFTGDILVHPIPYCFGGYFEEWVQQLDTMLSMRPKVILPGHGEVLRDTMYLRTVRDAFARLIEQTKAGFAKGITDPDTLRASIDMSHFRTIMAGDDFNRNWAFDNYMMRPGVARLVKELTGQLAVDTAAN